MKNKRLPCRSCDLLAAQIEETNGDCYRQYNQILQKLMKLEQQGEMELFAGDCPLEDTYTMLEAEQHYTICHYTRCRNCGALFCGGLHPGYASGSADGRYSRRET